MACGVHIAIITISLSRCRLWCCGAFHVWSDQTTPGYYSILWAGSCLLLHDFKFNYLIKEREKCASVAVCVVVMLYVGLLLTT